MQSIVEFLKSDIMTIAIPIVLLIVIILYIINCVKLKKIEKNYNTFLRKLGKSDSIDEDLSKYIEKVENIDYKNRELEAYCDKISKKIRGCVQKVGIVRYTAYDNIGSDLSFALALLDEENNGVVLNGIYATDMSNIYAKPVINGESEYKLSEQELEAIKKAKLIEYK